MIERLNKLLELEELSPSQFADRLGVQRSGISHVLNGRNKPSLDLISKILRSFPDIDPDWLILSIGEPYRKEKGSGNNTEATLFHSGRTIKRAGEQEKGPEKSPEKAIVKVIVFYSDKTFDAYIS